MVADMAAIGFKWQGLAGEATIQAEQHGWKAPWMRSPQPSALTSCCPAID